MAKRPNGKLFQKGQMATLRHEKLEKKMLREIKQEYVRTK